jgi:hypothetical protein
MALPPEARNTVGQLARNQRILTEEQWGDGRPITDNDRVRLQAAQKKLQRDLQDTLSNPAQPGYTPTPESYEQSSPTPSQENPGGNQGAPGTTQSGMASRPAGGKGLVGGRPGNSGQDTPWGEAPPTWSSAEGERRFFDVVGRFKDEFGRVPLEILPDEGSSRAPVRVTDWGQVLRYNSDVIARRMNEVRANGYDENEWLESVIGEELIHSRQLLLGRKNTGDYYKQLYNYLPPRVKKLLPGIYTSAVDASGKVVPFKAALEYERMIIQYRNTGTTSEEAMGRDIDQLRPFLEGEQVPAIENNIAQVESLITHRLPAEPAPGGTRGLSNYSFDDDTPGAESMGFGSGD